MLAARSPFRLAVAVLAAVLICQLGFGLAMATIRTRSNVHAAEASAELMRGRLSQIATDLTAVANDYNHWTEAYRALLRGDADWVNQNYGLSATNGEIFDGVIFYGGPLGEPWAWSAAQVAAEPSPAFLDRDLLRSIEAEVAKQPLGARQTYDTAVVVDGRLTLLSATWLQPSDDDLPEDLRPEDVPVAVITETLELDEMAALAESLSVQDLSFGPAAQPNRTSLAVPGPEGAPVGVLSWSPPRPGDALLREMLPVLAGLIVMNIALGAAAAWLAGRTADMAFRETMTGLPNRRAFNHHLEELERRRVPQVGVLFIDVNGFKAVNDALGHAAGDELVVEVAQRLSGCLGDGVFLSRLGGDEFAFVLQGEAGLKMKAEVLGRLVARAMNEPVSLRGSDLHITLSQGLGFRDGLDLSLEEVLRRADVAMYRAKRDRLLDVQLYGPEIDGEVARDLDLEAALRSALESPEEFHMLYQPVVRARGEELVRAEALARWTSPRLGVVPPNVFIRVAEQRGLMSALGRIILERVCADLARCPDLQVSINLSPVQLRDPRFLSDLDVIMARHDVHPGQIELELTEGVMIDNADRARQSLLALRARGFRVALDDFGTGFSSIGYLTSMPFDTLKIDQVFLRHSDDLMKNLSLIRAIVHLAHTLDKTVVCEGVETPVQAAALLESGCDELQGHLFARPMPLENLVEAYPETLRLVA